MVRFVDDAGAAVSLASEVSRIVSLVPSLTEALAFELSGEVGGYDELVHASR
jgi:ABC-type Fe3+-hydroxamate transport system substrate-binding protein